MPGVTLDDLRICSPGGSDQGWSRVRVRVRGWLHVTGGWANEQ